MGYSTSRDLGSLLDPRAAGQAARRITANGGGRLHDNVRRNTPVHHGFERPGRPPGTLRRSIRQGPVVPRADGYETAVFSEDPVAGFIEWGTRAHEIRPRDPAGTLRWMGPGGARFAKVVHHPGTRAQHAFSNGAAKTSVEVESLARPELERFARDLINGA